MAKADGYATTTRRLVALANITSDLETKRAARSDLKWMQGRKTELGAKTNPERRSIGPKRLLFGPTRADMDAATLDELHGIILRAIKADQVGRKVRARTNLLAAMRLIRSGLSPAEVKGFAAAHKEDWKKFKRLIVKYRVERFLPPDKGGNPLARARTR